MKKKIVISSAIASLFIMLFQITVFAVSLGTIDFIAIDSDNYVVEGLEVAVYKIGVFNNDKFELTENLKNCGINIENYSIDDIKEIEKYAKQNSAIMQTNITDSNGNFSLENIELGVYLLVQNNKQDEYSMQTMIIKIPEFTSKRGLEYSITAKPKISPKEIKGGLEENDYDEDFSWNDESKSPEKNGNKINNSEDTELPYTGVLNWPIPVFTILGIAIFCIAWLRYFSKKKIN